MISHHITDIMIGRTLQSMLVIIYRRHQHASLDRQAEVESPSPHLDPSACCDKKNADKQKTQTRWQNHTADGLRVWLGWAGGRDWFHGFVSVAARPRKRDDLLLVQECLGRGGTSQQIVAEVRGRCWAGVELSGGRHPCKTGLWEAGREEVKRDQVFLVNHNQLLNRLHESLEMI